MLLDALRRLGVSAGLAPPRAAIGLDAGACFASPAGGESLVAGRKVVGSAQLREGGALLQHGSLLLAGRQSTVQDVTLGSPPSDLALALADLTGRAADPGAVAEAVACAASSAGAAPGSAEAADGALLTEASSHGVRFRSPAWTWRA